MIEDAPHEVVAADHTGASVQTVAQRTDVRPVSHRSLRSELAHAYLQARGRTARRDTLDGLESVVAWLRRCERASRSDTIYRSMPQAFRGIGWETTGKIREDRQAHRNRLANWLDMLTELGVVASWEALYRANGEGRCIVVALRRDSSVGEAILAAAGASRRPPRRPGGHTSLSVPHPEEPSGRRSSCTRVSPPLREKSPSNGSTACSGVGKLRRRARDGAQTTDRVVRRLAESSEEQGAQLVAASPWLAEVPVTALLRGAAAVYRTRPAAGWKPGPRTRLTIRRSTAEAAERYVAQLDRLDGRGAGAAAVIDLAAGGWRMHAPAGVAEHKITPCHPGALVRGLRQRARLARDVARSRRDYAAASMPGGSERPSSAFTSAEGLR